MVITQPTGNPFPCNNLEALIKSQPSLGTPGTCVEVTASESLHKLLLSHTLALINGRNKMKHRGRPVSLACPGISSGEVNSSDVAS